MSVDHGERRRAAWGARILAPIALIAAGAVVAMVVAAGLEGNSTSPEPETQERPSRTIEGCVPTDPEALRAGYYVVEPGDPGLSGIAERTCVPVDRLLRLNSELDPRLIAPGACVDLRRDGCAERADA